jgi:hypothetical protein
MEIEKLELSNKLFFRLESLRKTGYYQSFVNSILEANRDIRAIGSRMLNIPCKVIYYKPEIKVKSAILKKINDYPSNKVLLHLKKNNLDVETRQILHFVVDKLTTDYSTIITNNGEVRDGFGCYDSQNIGFFIMPYSYNFSISDLEKSPENIELEAIKNQLSLTNPIDYDMIESIASMLMKYVSNNI